MNELAVAGTGIDPLVPIRTRAGDRRIRKARCPACRAAGAHEKCFLGPHPSLRCVSCLHVWILP